MASKETMELLEQVLSESKAYRKWSAQAQEKGQELADEYATAKANGNKEEIRKAAINLKKFNDSLAKYGRPYPVKNLYGGKSSEVYDKDMAEMLGGKYKEWDNEFKRNTGSARPKNPAVHANINARQEAAQILIEALDTLLSE